MRLVSSLCQDYACTINNTFEEADEVTQISSLLQGQHGKRTSLRALAILEQLSSLSFPIELVRQMVDALLPLLLDKGKR